MINRDIERFDQDKLFEGKNVHDQVGFSIKQYVTFFTNLSLAETLLVMIKIGHGFMMK